MSCQHCRLSYQSMDRGYVHFLERSKREAWRGRQKKTRRRTNAGSPTGQVSAKGGNTLLTLQPENEVPKKDKAPALQRDRDQTRARPYRTRTKPRPVGQRPRPVQEKLLCAQLLVREYKGHETIVQTSLFHREITKDNQYLRQNVRTCKGFQRQAVVELLSTTTATLTL